jgi:DNA polymerase-1
MSRFDSFGMFWEDQPRERASQNAGPRVPTPPPIPDTGWCAPGEFPRLEDAKELVIDVETYDPNLDDRGPGWATGDGHVVGLAVGTHDRQWYFPMRHENPDGTLAGGNMDPSMVLKWAKRELTRDSQSKLGANLLYDVGWLKREGVEVKGELVDVQFAEALLDEHSFSYALASLGKKYLSEGKTEDKLYDWLYRAYGGREGRKQAANIYRSPVALCGPYAESDVDLPFRIHEKQLLLLAKEGLTDLFRMECDLIYQLIEMRWNGVRVDVEKAERTKVKFEERELVLQKSLDKFSGRSGFNPDASTDMQAAFDRLGLKYPKTQAGNPSFAKGVLEGLDHPFTNAILESRKLSKARGTFIEGYILDKSHNGRVHGEFHSLKRDEDGTVTGRFSSSKPNLGNIPARDPEMKRLIRGLFLPEEGEQWFAPDYSQIQFREITHYAMGRGAEEARQKYRDDPKTDYHDLTKEIIDNLLGGDMDRKPVKNINFGLAFGMSEKRIVHDLGPEGSSIIQAYHEALPFVRHTSDVAKQRASNRGYLKSIRGRRVRFPFWECGRYMTAEDKKRICDEKGDPKWFSMTKDRALAVDKWGSAKRAMLHKALVSLAQATEADIMKASMLAIYKAGLPTPLVTVYDELGFSLPNNSGGIKTSEEIMRLMRETTTLSVPILVDGDFGDTWGDC